MKSDRFVAFCALVFAGLLAFSMMPCASLAEAAQTRNPDIKFYKIDVRLDEESRSFVQLVMTFRQPDTRFAFKVLGRVENFNASSNAGPVECQVAVSGTSDIECAMNLTDMQKELKLSFETIDFVKPLDNKFYFSADLTPHASVDSTVASLRLPPNSLLVGEDISSSVLSYPDKASAHIAGGIILINWDFSSLAASDALKLEVLYERVATPPWFQLRLRYFVLAGAAFAVVLGFIIVRHFRKSDKLVLSVLDEYERKIVDIVSAEGEVKQKKIVELTNMSKAKVSRVIKSLVNRGVVDVERSGRTNRVRMSKKKLEGQ